MRYSTLSLTILHCARTVLEAHPEGFLLNQFEQETVPGLLDKGSAVLHFMFQKTACAPMDLEWSQDAGGVWRFTAILLGTEMVIRQNDLEDAVTTAVRNLLDSVVARRSSDSA